ncbi:MAG: archaeosortase/exosortase family protein [Planctomycetota bacterium]
MISRRLKKNGWTIWHVMSALVMVLSAIAVTWRGWARIIDLGLTRAVAGHVFLVPVVVVFLVWVRRKRVLACRPSGSLMGLVLAGLGVAAFVYGGKRAHPSLFHLGAVLLPAGCLVSILGQQVFRAYLPAFIVLIALIPPPIGFAEQLAQPLQIATGRLTCWLYALLGSTAELSGSQLRIGRASVRLSDVAAGLPMAMSLSLISYGFVFGTPLRMSVRLAILLLSPLSAIVCSALALAATLWLYNGLSQEQAALWLRIGEWTMLLVAFLSLVAAMRVLIWASVPVRRYPLAYDQ